MVADLVTYEWDDEIGPVVFFNRGERRIGLCFCHRREDRSIRFFGLERIFCSRCTGILLGGILGLLLLFCHYRVDPAWSALLLLPMVIDGFLQLFEYRESDNTTRLVTGFLFGFGLQFFLVAVLR